MATYVQYCLVCHGPAGEGFMEPGAQGTGRIGMPLGGNTYATKLNQEGIQADGTPVAGGLEAREELIRETLYEGRGLMPAWEGQLNDEEINELTYMIQHADWDEVYNYAIAENGGKYPTPGPPPANAAQAANTQQQAPQNQNAGQAEASPQPNQQAPQQAAPPAAAAPPVTVNMVDIAFEPEQFTIPANAPATVNLPNNGAAVHNFVIDELGVKSADVPGGGEDSVEINAAAGEYQYYCSQPGHKEAGMVGTLTVE
jgi:plastocyanin